MAISPLLSATINSMQTVGGEEALMLTSQMSATATGGQVPISVRMPRLRPNEGEAWEKYRLRVEEQLEPLREETQAVMGIETKSLLAAGSLE